MEEMILKALDAMFDEACVSGSLFEGFFPDNCNGILFNFVSTNVGRLRLLYEDEDKEEEIFYINIVRSK